MHKPPLLITVGGQVVLHDTHLSQGREIDAVSEELRGSSYTGATEIVVKLGTGTGKKTEELDGAGGVGARGSVATVYARQAGRLLKRRRLYLALTNALVRPLPVLTSDRHVLRHVLHCRFSARGNLHRYLDLVAKHPVVLARAQPL
eukprot:6183987-Pleurochrysis_carterae.AAC.2